MDIKLYGCLAVEMFSSLDIKLHIVFNKPYHHRNKQTIQSWYFPFSQVSKNINRYNFAKSVRGQRQRLNWILASRYDEKTTPIRKLKIGLCFIMTSFLLRSIMDMLLSTDVTSAWFYCRWQYWQHDTDHVEKVGRVNNRLVLDKMRRARKTVTL